MPSCVWRPCTQYLYSHTLQYRECTTYVLNTGLYRCTMSAVVETFKSSVLELGRFANWIHFCRPSSGPPHLSHVTFWWHRGWRNPLKHMHTHIHTYTNLAGDRSVVKGIEILQIRLSMSNPAVSGCLLLSGWKIGTITCKHGGNDCGARQADHREMQVSNKDLTITLTVMAGLPECF